MNKFLKLANEDFYMVQLPHPPIIIGSYIVCKHTCTGDQLQRKFSSEEKSIAAEKKNHMIVPI